MTTEQQIFEGQRLQFSDGIARVTKVSFMEPSEIYPDGDWSVHFTYENDKWHGGAICQTNALRYVMNRTLDFFF